MLYDRYRLELMRNEFAELQFAAESRAAEREFRKLGDRKRMTNFQYLFTAWILVWAIFFGYELSVASRISTLRKDIEQLKRQLGEK